MGDARRVKGLKPIKNALPKIIGLAPVQFKNETSDADFQSGFIAQDLEKVFPEFVLRPNGDNGTAPNPINRPGSAGVGWKIIALEMIVPWIVAAIKELNDDLDQLKKRTNKRIKDVDDRFTALEAQVAALQSFNSQNSDRFTAIEAEQAALDKRIDTLEAS